jgi:hypothetical protein
VSILRSSEKTRGYVHHRTPSISSFDHADLQSLDADDHPQYFNEARGDDRYYTKVVVDGLLEDQDALSELTDVVITTPTTGDVLYYNGSNWVNTDSIVITPAAAVELKYNDIVAFATTETGINILSTNTDNPFFRFVQDDGTTFNGYLQMQGGGIAVWENEVHGGEIRLVCEDSGGTNRFPFRVAATGTATEVGFHATTPIVKPTVTGSRGGNAALASLLTALSNYGLITDSSTA